MMIAWSTGLGRPGGPTSAEPTYHYVRLDSGNSTKDCVDLTSLRQENSEHSLMLGDASTEVLCLAGRDLIVRFRIPGSNPLALRWDFSTRHNITALRYLLTGAFGDAPVLFFLPNNSLANFDGDTGILTQLAAELLRPQDRILLEVATTSDLSVELAAQAAEEYRTSENVKEFILDALRLHTDLPVDKGSLQCVASVEGNRALLIKMSYRNQTNSDITITLANRNRVTFKPNDTIRLALVRKYTNNGLDDMFAASSLTCIGEWQSSVTAAGPGFGLALKMLVRKPRDAGPATTPTSTLADHLWRR